MTSLTLPPLTVGQDASAKIANLFLDRPSGKTRILAAALSSNNSNYQQFCQHLTRKDCAEAEVQSSNQPSTSSSSLVSKILCQDGACNQVHFELIMLPQTDLSLGHCSYLNTCHRTHVCRYLHFKPIPPPNSSDFPFHTNTISSSASSETKSLYGQNKFNSHQELNEVDSLFSTKLNSDKRSKHPVQALRDLGLEDWVRGYEKFDRSHLIPSGDKKDGGENQENLIEKKDEHNTIPPAQWLNCDLKNFDYSILGKFDVIMADPPWDIHMSLPYGTMTDNDMRSMPVTQLQDEGFISYGYTRVDELIWVKVGQTQRLIRTGRTGHWLNHTKEHCLVGSKTKSLSQTSKKSDISSLSSTYSACLSSGIPTSKTLPSFANIGLSSDVIVSEVRDTSKKPDEIYNIIENLCPGGRKLELFGRKNNRKEGWITLGNQLNGDFVCEKGLKERVDDWREKEQRI